MDQPIDGLQQRFHAQVFHAVSGRLEKGLCAGSLAPASAPEQGPRALVLRVGQPGRGPHLLVHLHGLFEVLHRVVTPAQRFC